MKVIRLLHNETHALDQIVRVLDAGGVCVVPTDTVYGIVAAADNEVAIEKFLAIKERPREKIPLLFVRDVAQARYFAYISDKKARFLEQMWPGAVTVIFAHKGKLFSFLSGDGTVGMRIPNHSFLAAVLDRIERPLAQTSANISGGAPAKNITEILAYFESHEPKPDFIIDAGEIAGAPSTIINFVHDMPLIVRSGMITKSELDALVNGE